MMPLRQDASVHITMPLMPSLPQPSSLPYDCCNRDTPPGPSPSPPAVQYPAPLPVQAHSGPPADLVCNGGSPTEVQSCTFWDQQQLRARHICTPEACSVYYILVLRNARPHPQYIPDSSVANSVAFQILYHNSHHTLHPTLSLQQIFPWTPGLTNLV